MRFYTRVSIIFLTTVCISYHSCLAQETMMDQVDQSFLDTLISLAKKHYPKVKFFEARSNSYKSALQTEKLGWLQPLTFSYVYQPNNAVSAVNPVFLSGYQFGMFINIGSLIQRPSVIKKAREELKAAESEQAEYDILIATEVKKRYYDYLLQLNMLRVLTKNLLDAQAMLSDIGSRYQKSEISFEEYSKALLLVNVNTQSKLEKESNLLIARSALEELTGIKPEELKNDGTRKVY